MNQPKFAERSVALLLFALAAALFVGAKALPDDAGYAGLSARFFPLLLVPSAAICGLMLLRESLTGGFRNLEEVPDNTLDWRSIGWIFCGVLLGMALLEWLGFVVFCAVVLAFVAHALRTNPVASARAWMLNAATGAALGLACLAVFRGFLSVNLPVLPIVLGY